MENMERLILELIKEDNERPWLEFKHNNYEPEMIGRDICALANGAALKEKPCAYMIWGIDDETREIVGTDYDLQNLRKGNQELENWLRSLLSENADFTFEKVYINDVYIGLLKIQRASNYPVSFQKTEYIRVGSYTKALRDYPAVQTQLWDRLRNENFEDRNAKEDLEMNHALSLLDYTAYFDITDIPLPSTMEGVAHYFLQEDCLVEQDNGLIAITNMGALLFAKKLTDFKRLDRKAIRVVQYDGINRIKTLKEYSNIRGYGVDFEDLINYISALLPSKEIINGALRTTWTAYPILAIRESVANALIHQDFSVTGTGPTVEIFSDRIEITNAGAPLVDIDRIIDNPPRSRNEKIAAMMRRLKVCEELGTGWDKIVLSCELQQLPAPKIEVHENSTRVTLYSERLYKNLPPEDRLRACYLHACIKYVQGEYLTNGSLRERLGLKDSSSGNVSRLIKEAVDLQLLKPLDPTTAPRHMKYMPFWA